MAPPNVTLPYLEMWDADKVIYDEWEGEDCLNNTDSPAKCFGMRYNASNSINALNKHGIVRIESEDGKVEEGAWYGASVDWEYGNAPYRHGLRRTIDGNEATVELWLLGDLTFKSKFNENFVETERWISDAYIDETSVDYWHLMESVFPYRFAKEKNDAAMLDAMLTSPPVGINANQTLMWERMHPMSVELFEEYWNMTNTSQVEPMIDWSEVAYSEWSEEIEEELQIVRFYGVKHLESEQAVGVVRQIIETPAYVEVDEKYLKERTYDLHANENGLCREIHAKGDEPTGLLLETEVSVKFVAADAGSVGNTAEFTFDWYFAETDRQGNETYFEDLNPKSFKLDDDDFMDKVFA